jgi:hypothetical protein
MQPRWYPVVLSLFALVAMGCEAKASRETRDPASASDAYLTPAPAAPVGEQRLDTTTSAPAPAPVTTIAVRPTTKPGGDENLPSWVPLTGRLTVVEAPDLAENLGLVPQGTTKTQGRISVAEALAQNTVAPATAPGGSIRSATWLASNGRVRHARR